MSVGKAGAKQFSNAEISQMARNILKGGKVDKLAANRYNIDASKIKGTTHAALVKELPQLLAGTKKV